DARIFTGRLQGSADISLKRGEPGHTAKIQVENIDFPALTKLYFNYDTSQGMLSGNYDFSGRGDDVRTMQGHGNLSVVKGDVFAIPVFGPLSGILNGIVPGMGYNVARQAEASFDVRDGVITTGDFNVKGQGFEMVGGGKVSIPDDRINFNIRINASGLPGVLLFPVSKLFEYTIDSPLSKPSWRPARAPSM
ncbi:MAG: AsmA-like C-terminal region-containing protein, partial [Verrucomicrobiota bacterium]